mgnify:CR=1 FL=1
MNVRTLLRSLASAVAGAAVSFAAAAQPVWKIGTVVAPPSMLGIIVDEGAASIGVSTGGRIKAERHQIANEQEITQNLIRGRLEMGYISATGLAVAVPEMGVLNTPYLWTSEKERDYVSDRHVAPFLEGLLASKGLVLLKYGEAGWTSLFCKTPCTTPAAMRGMKMRVSPTAGARMMAERLGVNGVGMSLADFYPALQQGVVDAGDLTFSFYLIGPAATAAPHYVFTRHNHQPAFWLAHKGTWERVPAEDRAAIIRGLPNPVQARARVAGDEVTKIAQFRARGGFAHELTDEQRAEWAKVIVPGQPALIASYGGRAKELFDIIQKGKREFAALRN